MIMEELVDADDVDTELVPHITLTEDDILVVREELLNSHRLAIIGDSQLVEM